MKILTRLMTENLTKIPLFWLSFNYKYFKKYGKENSCIFHVHTELAGDSYIKETMNDIVNYIRENYDMNKII